jgi:hypothetical protein
MVSGHQVDRPAHLRTRCGQVVCLGCCAPPKTMTPPDRGPARTTTRTDRSASEPDERAPPGSRERGADPVLERLCLSGTYLDQGFPTRGCSSEALTPPATCRTSLRYAQRDGHAGDPRGSIPRRPRRSTPMASSRRAPSGLRYDGCSPPPGTASRSAAARGGQTSPWGRAPPPARDRRRPRGGRGAGHRRDQRRQQAHCDPPRHGGRRSRLSSRRMPPRVAKVRSIRC